MEENLDPKIEVNKGISDNTNKSNSNEITVPKSEKIIEQEKEIKINKESPNSKKTSEPEVDVKNTNNPPAKTIPKQKKELPIEKKPFQEFINLHLIPELAEEINQRGLKINNINLKNTKRPIAEDKCWVINCNIEDTCSFWLSFEKEDISSLKSISLSKPNQKPSIIESFLIDEKKITLKLIISRILQRLNGQKLIGIN
ncbi:MULTISPECIES: DUF2996 domain-containing protein [Prochlorococcus]|uniref:Type II secretory pathway n=1 Tax=Prochlorococcus marinus str. MIT 9116 TaxID=167544 RepID=A0A0A1ZLI6_PROMR|nr:DUF2996 domain-containing protein [Prochlorococcus marinus]KGF89524.1 Type II secretory pathway [Prochlorococcus marinus str. MIT 9107]KGF90467.1 Type II secretory pathway [Prochlorococcus marinus str. MIT 9116]KGF92946.1 Type II secretory pathway [Prochlorococcus marinus str. MIT 9123]